MAFTKKYFKNVNTVDNLQKKNIIVIMYKVKLSKQNESSNIEKIFKINNGLDFEDFYFYCLRKKYKRVSGYINDKIEFVIENGLEVCDDRAKILSIDPNNWTAPNVDQFKGMIAQFKNKKSFYYILGVTRAAVNNWEKGRPIDFYRWSHLLSYLNISRTFDEESREVHLKCQR